jgi:hypothetical protein
MTMTKTERRTAAAALKRTQALDRLRAVVGGGRTYAHDAGKAGYRVINFETTHSVVVSADVLKAGMDDGLDIKVTL